MERSVAMVARPVTILGTIALPIGKKTTLHISVLNINKTILNTENSELFKSYFLLHWTQSSAHIIKHNYI